MTIKNFKVEILSSENKYLFWSLFLLLFMSDRVQMLHNNMILKKRDYLSIEGDENKHLIHLFLKQTTTISHNFLGHSPLFFLWLSRGRWWRERMLQWQQTNRGNPFLHFISKEFCLFLKIFVLWFFLCFLFVPKKEVSFKFEKILFRKRHLFCFCALIFRLFRVLFWGYIIKSISLC